MGSLPPESRAFHRELIVALLTFAIAFVALGAVVIVLHLRYLIPERGWWGVADGIRWLLEIPLFGALASAVGTATLLNRWHYRRGLYRCNLCGRTLTRGIVCRCRADGFHERPRRRSKCRRYRKQIRPALLGYALLAPAALAVAVGAHRLDHWPFTVDVLVAHAVICGLLLFIGESTLAALELFGRGRRVRKRWRVFALVFALYPCAVVLVVIAFR